MNHFPAAEIKIHQVLFGYRDGHHLLASSVKLDKEETQLMERLSDGPGMDIPPAFDGYLTGYALPTSPYYAIGKTWSAKELPRPGCVWTHALLIPKDIPLTQIRDKITESLFSRPDTQRINWRKSYQCPVTLFEEYSLDSEATRCDACRVLTWMMEGDAVLVISDRSGRFHDALLFLLFYAGALLWEDFSFSTFSRTFRKISPQEPFHLQIAPRAFQPILQRQFSGNPVFDIRGRIHRKIPFWAISSGESCAKRDFRRKPWIACRPGKRLVSDFREIVKNRNFSRIDRRKIPSKV